MAHYNWANKITEFYFNPDNVRDPTLIFNNTALKYGCVAGYSDTDYAFSPINFAPAVNTPSTENFTLIKLDQFGIPDDAKLAIITINAGIAGLNKWLGTIYSWFRKPGSNWHLSPIFDGGYLGSITVYCPVGPAPDGRAAIEFAWGTLGLDPTNWGTGTPGTDQAWLVGILSGWGK